MKVRRFVIEYANYRIDQYSKVDLLSGSEEYEKAAETIREIDRAVRLLQQGLLSVDETIRMINEA